MDQETHPIIMVIGSLNMDIVVKATRSPTSGETIIGKNIHFIPGGKGANQAVAAARLGAKTIMIGSLGVDEFGKSLSNSLQAEKVDIRGINMIDDVHSGIASIILTEEDNRIIVVPGANNFCLTEDVERHQELMRQADIVLLQLEIPIPTVHRAIQLAHEQQKPVILNPAPATELSDQLLSMVDYITPNQHELTHLTGITDLEQAMSALLDRGPKNVITTLGKAGAAWMKQDRTLVQFKGYSVPVVDTTGAGDSFNAAFAYSIAQKKSIEEAISMAIKVSALKVTKLGAQTGMPYLEEVQQFQLNT
ncbi:ribokinase [Seinonella peptonophila]|uniref:Ribokinase n=1 Tax=Seinonella peptonophila TaxID=112248 RepID=A0A1M5B9X2_9BACL|nr:ribokinase [Seinonella peptonophila]SHF39248.1 ribokinase [Seinonella peptonophila]